MNLIEAIKTLKPAERFKALLFVGIISSLTAISVSYMKTDDCKGISEQYDQVLKNYSSILKINNDLLSENNKRTEDIMRIQGILERLNINTVSVDSSTNITSTIGEPIINETTSAETRIVNNTLIKNMERPDRLERDEIVSADRIERESISSIEKPDRLERDERVVVADAREVSSPNVVKTVTRKIVKEVPKTEKITKVKVIKSFPKEQKNLIDSILTITKSYNKN